MVGTFSSFTRKNVNENFENNHTNLYWIRVKCWWKNMWLFWMCGAGEMQAIFLMNQTILTFDVFKIKAEQSANMMNWTNCMSTCGYTRRILYNDFSVFRYQRVFLYDIGLYTCFWTDFPQKYWRNVSLKLDYYCHRIYMSAISPNVT